MEWYHVWWPWLTSKRVVRFVSDSWVSCYNWLRESVRNFLVVCPSWCHPAEIRPPHDERCCFLYISSLMPTTGLCEDCDVDISKMPYWWRVKILSTAIKQSVSRNRAIDLKMQRKLHATTNTSHQDNPTCDTRRYCSEWLADHHHIRQVL